MFTDENVGGISCTKTNLLQQKSWRCVTQGENMRRFNCWILIQENQTKLWKRWIAKQYKDWDLVASYPADHLYDIDLSFFYD